MKRTILIARSAGVLALALLAGCAAPPPFGPVTEPSARIEAGGFSVLPPKGADWVIGADPGRSSLVFGKADRKSLMHGRSFIVNAARQTARTGDVANADALRGEVDAAIAATSGRMRVVQSKTEAYVDSELGTDCVRFETLIEERNNPKQPGKLLLMTSYGKACRHPDSPTHYVVLTCSERRPADSAPLLNEALRGECARTLDSLRFRPLP